MATFALEVEHLHNVWMALYAAEHLELFFSHFGAIRMLFCVVELEGNPPITVRTFVYRCIGNFGAGWLRTAFWVEACSVNLALGTESKKLVDPVGGCRQLERLLGLLESRGLLVSEAVH